MDKITNSNRARLLDEVTRIIKKAKLSKTRDVHIGVYPDKLTVNVRRGTSTIAGFTWEDGTEHDIDAELDRLLAAIDPSKAKKKTAQHSNTHEYVYTKQFSDDTQLSEVEPKTKLPEGTFTKSAEEIKDTIFKYARDKTHAIRMINFYINRAGDNLPNAEEVMKAKDLIENS